MASVVGVGETDYRTDYARARANDPTYVPPDPQSLAIRAFENALTDARLRREDIDGLTLTFPYGGPDANAMAQSLGITPRFTLEVRAILGVASVVGALVDRQCDTVAMVYAAASRAIGRQYGGTTFTAGAEISGPPSYYYYHPWGWSSQAAHWALMWQYYMATYGAKEEDLGSVAVTIRDHARLNKNAIMQGPLTVQDYLASRYIVRPLHLFDLCLVNDGAVCLILRRTDMSRGLAHAPALVAGWGQAQIHESKMQVMVRERLRPQLRKAGQEALQMANLTLSDIDHFQGYDAASIHLINQLEGFGFVEVGEGLEYWKGGNTRIGGKLPVNTSGGMLSESYMHGWNHVAEAVRQLRHEAGRRQIQDVETSMFSFTTTDAAYPLIFTRS